MPISYRAAQTLIKRGDEPALRAALDQHLDPNLTNPNGWSLLMLAAVEGSVPLGRLLIQRGAKPNTLNSKNGSALSIATKKGHAPFIEFLTAHCASSN
ncbi:MAG: ankyrin repeat domain-containing protein [Acidobacteriota bacterium]|nr:ankyrin repeat domain-containing protein [Acidobacteriota bacterium]